jgi:hypothetical protein
LPSVGRNKELDLKDREIELEGMRSTLLVREQELRQREQSLVAKEKELRRAGALDARAIALEEDRLRAMEGVLLGRLREADAALDALEAAHRGPFVACGRVSCSN